MTERLPTVERMYVRHLLAERLNATVPSAAQSAANEATSPAPAGLVSSLAPVIPAPMVRQGGRPLTVAIVGSGPAAMYAADELLTQSLKQALALVDIRTLDHFVVAGGQLTSFAERGLL